MRVCCVLAVLVVFSLAGCATAPPLPSRAAFSEQILDPLADKRAGEMLDAWKADARLRAAQAQGNGSPLDLIALAADVLQVFPGAGSALRALKGNPEAKLNEYEKWLDTRRGPLKAKLETLYESRIQEQNDGQVFTVCADGHERRYARQPSFPRLDDGPGPCPVTKITLTD
jgi:hypothetical protein